MCNSPSRNPRMYQSLLPFHFLRKISNISIRLGPPSVACIQSLNLLAALSCTLRSPEDEHTWWPDINKIVSEGEIFGRNRCNCISRRFSNEWWKNLTAVFPLRQRWFFKSTPWLLSYWVKSRCNKKRLRPSVQSRSSIIYFNISRIYVLMFNTLDCFELILEAAVALLPFQVFALWWHQTLPRTSFSVVTCGIAGKVNNKNNKDKVLFYEESYYL